MAEKLSDGPVGLCFLDLRRPVSTETLTPRLKSSCD
ncbi:hypothetical protein F442_03879 [Phytophthora nicotianae P10297]|uniref:Uncharacterized protein n=2 Tax=Phytophthora nicotianae TaxID=4792 RepID=W2ZV76_PHYNI|nr:hypothetical protein L915_03775 [Phytophthora nicotianae]ETP50906.1 hypothetical protein F442_03879 [Phytophthora nicotianae P10297]